MEVDAGDAATVAAADDVRVVLAEPSDDPAAQPDRWAMSIVAVIGDCTTTTCIALAAGVAR